MAKLLQKIVRECYAKRCSVQTQAYGHVTHLKLCISTPVHGIQTNFFYMLKTGSSYGFSDRLLSTVLNNKYNDE